VHMPPPSHDEPAYVWDLIIDMQAALSFRKQIRQGGGTRRNLLEHLYETAERVNWTRHLSPSAPFEVAKCDFKFVTHYPATGCYFFKYLSDG